MTKEINTSIIINATTQQVWNVLTDFDSYPLWNPFVKSITGKVAVNNRVKIKLPGMQFKPVVLAFEANRELRWLGNLLVKGLFDGEHQFLLRDNGNGTTTFLHSEKFSGLLVPIFSKKLDTETRQGFEQMNLALKERAERG